MFKRDRIAEPVRLPTNPDESVTLLPTPGPAWFPPPGAEPADYYRRMDPEGRGVLSNPSERGRPRASLLDLIAIGVFLVSVVSAVIQPSAMLQAGRPQHPSQVLHPEEPDGGGDSTISLRTRPGRDLAIKGTGDYGCVQVRAEGPAPTVVACNRTLSCVGDEPPEGESGLIAYVLSDSSPYQVWAGSMCNSSCCDYRGMSFDGTGQRTDDGPFDRVRLRLGIFGLFSLILAIFSLFGLAWVHARPGRTRATFRGLSYLGLMMATATLWLHM